MGARRRVTSPSFTRPRRTQVPRRWENPDVGPVAILDKSALQALSLDESVWLEAFLRVNVPPLFYAETVADLEKSVRHGSPEDFVRALADKTPGNAVPNVHHREMMLSELAGGTISMDHRPVIREGVFKQASDGQAGWHIDDFPEAQMLHRWKRHEFHDAERTLAKRWRAELAQQDLGRTVALVKNPWAWPRHEASRSNGAPEPQYSKA